jgi:hypothetical protein
VPSGAQSPGGVLTTDPIDGTVKRMLACYVDTDAFIHRLNTSWSTHHHSYGQLSSQSLYREFIRLADGYPKLRFRVRQN